MTIYNDTGLLHPKFRPVVTRLHQTLIGAYEAGRTKSRFEIFETYRDPIRQRDLLKKGATKAGIFQSAHAFGLAVDFVPYITGQEALDLGDLTGEKVLTGWNWHSSNDWDFLKKTAEEFGLSVPIAWDRGHVQSPLWQQIRPYTV